MWQSFAEVSPAVLEAPDRNIEGVASVKASLRFDTHALQASLAAAKLFAGRCLLMTSSAMSGRQSHAELSVAGVHISVELHMLPEQLLVKSLLASFSEAPCIALHELSTLLTTAALRLATLSRLSSTSTRCNLGVSETLTVSSYRRIAPFRETR